MDYSSNNATELGIKSANVASLVMYGKVIGVIIAGITFIIVARLLGASQYGVYILALGIAGTFGAFANISVGNYFQKKIPELTAKKNHDEISKTLGSGITILFIISIAITLIGFAISPFVSGFFGGAGIIFALEIAFLTIISSALYGNLYSALIAFGDGNKSAISNIINNSVQSVLSIGLILLGFGAGGAIAGMVISQILSSIYLLKWINRHSKIKISIQHLKNKYKQMLSFSVPLTLSGVINTFSSNFTVVVLGLLVSTTIVGSYGVSMKIWNLIDIILGSISIVLIPMFVTAGSNANIKNKINKLYEYSIKYGLLFTMPVIMYVIIFSGNIINVMFSQSYAYGALYMSLAAISVITGIIGIFGSYLAISMGDVNKVLKYSVIVLILQIILIGFLILLSKFISVSQGYIGMGFIIIMSIISSIIADALYMNYMKGVLKLKINYNVLRIISANILIGLVFLIIIYLKVGQLLQMIIGFALLIALYPIALGYLKAITKDDIRLIKGSVSNIPLFGDMLKALINYADSFVRQ
jgi:O-antigen/teichoic acid export membrane protein